MLYKYQHYIAKRSQRVSSNSDCLGKGTCEATSLLFCPHEEEATFARSNSLWLHSPGTERGQEQAPIGTRLCKPGELLSGLYRSYSGTNVAGNWEIGSSTAVEDVPVCPKTKVSSLPPNRIRRRLAKESWSSADSMERLSGGGPIHGSGISKICHSVTSRSSTCFIATFKRQMASAIIAITLTFWSYDMVEGAKSMVGNPWNSLCLPYSTRLRLKVPCPWWETRLSEQFAMAL